MKKLILILILFSSIQSLATIKVAVIDTGFDIRSTWPTADKIETGYTRPVLCANHFNFISNTRDVTDNHGHGTHIAGLIAKYAEQTDYCILVLKYYDPKVPNTDNLKNSIRAFRYAITQKVDIINYSGGGTERSEEECTAVKMALDAGIRVVAAAGNERSNLDLHPYYPALCDARVMIVGNYQTNGKRAPSANYSAKQYWVVPEVGTDILSLLPKNQYGYMSGTSQATAIVTGKLVNKPYIIKKFDRFDARKYLKSYKLQLAS